MLWQELACIMHFAFWNVKFVCLYVGKSVVCVSGFVGFVVSEKAVSVFSVYYFQFAYN